MEIFLLFAILLLTVHGNAQNNFEDNLKDIFGSSTRSFLDDYDEVTKKPLADISAIQKCGEGSDQGVHVCVPYYNCDGQTRTIIQTGKTDGFGLIDIRLGASKCDDYMEVCCKIPTGGIPPDVVTQRPIVDPDVPLPSSTIPPINPNRGNNCGIRNPNGIDFKITGNKDNEAEYGEFPWMVAILDKNYNRDSAETFSICGGSLITPSVVLTGAHCVYKYAPSGIKIRAGEWDTQSITERVPYQERDVAKIIRHEQFLNTTLFNNVALLILSEPLFKADNVGTVCLPPQNLKFNSKNCFTMGWGKDVFGKQGRRQVILKKIELPTVSFNTCQQYLRDTRLGKFFELHKSFMCAGGESGKDACTGDGGSPLVCPDPENTGRYYQAGIVSWGIGCGAQNVPGVYADVAKFRNWIDTQMQYQNLITDPYKI